MKHFLLAAAIVCFLAPLSLAQSEKLPRTSAPSPSPAPSPANTPTPEPATETSEPVTSQPSEPAAKSTGLGFMVPAEKARPIVVTRFEKPPTIDGKLDEEVWKSAAVFKDFYQIDPGENTAPTKPTEVLVGYDSKFLYIAFRAFDEKEKVRATVAKRDNIFSDDYVGMFLDTFNDQRKAFEFFFNPLGIQGDGVITEGRGEDFSVDILMDSKGLINDDGYIVEIAIPF